MGTKEEQQDEFETWVTFLHDRVEDWTDTLEDEFKEKLDFTPESLPALESYILETYSIDTFQDKRMNSIMDAIVSYFGETLRSHLPKAYWKIELDDESDANFALPALSVPVGPEICPHLLFRRLQAKNQGDFLFKFFKLRLGFIENPETL
jgi:hypothetical protein